MARIYHSRFYKGVPVYKDSKFDKVVTTAWTYESSTSVLTYAATVFVKNGNSDFWNKKIHREETLKRFENNPIRIKLFREEGPELSNNAVDWYISRYLIFHCGTHNKVSPDVRRVHHELKIKSDFNEHYELSSSKPLLYYNEEEEAYSNCGVDSLIYYGIGVVTALLAQKLLYI